jgi:hypothetical protein
MLPSILPNPTSPPRQSASNNFPESPNRDGSLIIQSVVLDGGVESVFGGTSLLSGSQYTNSITDILTLQQRFDSTRRKLQQIGVAMKKERDDGVKTSLGEQSHSLQLLSTMLYLTLMMTKIDSIKSLLKSSSPSLYIEYQLIFDSLRSPSFHLTRHQDGLKKVKKLYDRKCLYKTQFEEARVQLQEYTTKVGKLQDLAVGTAAEFSEALKMIKSGELGGGGAQKAVEDELVALRSKVATLEQSSAALQNQYIAATNSAANFELQLAKKDAELVRVNKDLEFSNMVSSTSSSQASKELQAAISSADGRAEAAEARAAAAEAKLKEVEAREAAVVAKLAVADADESGMRAIIKQLSGKLTAREKEVEDLTGEVERLSAEAASGGNAGAGGADEKELLEVKKLLVASGESLAEVEGLLSQSQKKVTILETSLAEATSKSQNPPTPAKELRPPTGYEGTEYTPEQEEHCKKIQNCARKRAGYMRWFRIKLELTSNAGVMMALAGTVQGSSGFYLNPNTNMVYFWNVDDDTGGWSQVGTECSYIDFKNYCTEIRRKKEKHPGEEVLVAYGDIDYGRPGLYMGSGKVKLGHYIAGEHGILKLAIQDDTQHADDMSEVSSIASK